MSVSGFYLESSTNNRIRLDVDGYYPQKVVSGVIYFKNQNGGTDLLYWYIKNCNWNFSTNKAVGDIIYLFWNDKQIGISGWYSKVNFELNSKTGELKITFSGNNFRPITATYKYTYDNFQDVNIEFDYQKGFKPTLSVKPKAIFKPGEIPTDAEFKDLPDVLTIEEVLKRSGYKAHRTGKDNEVTINAPVGTNPMDYEWTNSELHDVMQAQWSLYNQNPNTMSLWTFITTKLKGSPDVAGRMFDSNAAGMNGDTNKKPRQGCALFYRQSTFNDNPPEWNEAAKFIATLHEMGHCFNLFHSFDKKATNSGLPKPFNPWVPGEMVDNSTTRSFMNYHSQYTGGTNYFKDFRYRYSDQELFFIRHAPKWFVRMGENEWGFNHATIGDFELIISPVKDSSVYNFLEPVVINIELKNTSATAKKIEQGILKDSHHTRLFIQKKDGKLQALQPFHYDCIIPSSVVLKPGESIKESYFVSADKEDWKISEPGAYSIIAVSDVNDNIITSNTFSLRVHKPDNKESDIIAQDYFTDGVARVLYYGGSKFLNKENAILEDMAGKLKKSNPEAAIHAKLSVLMPDTMHYNMVSFNKHGKMQFKLQTPNTKAINQLKQMLVKEKEALINTLGKSHYSKIIKSKS